jgi:tRNA threonylcarbamoyladenosine biosynthesis protein TsaB
MILCIETATGVCSVALCHEGSTIALLEDTEGRSHAARLTPLISQVLKTASTDISCLDAIAVSKGPGSYTGLRIGVSVAKGLAYALKKPLIAIGTLEAMCYGLLQKEDTSLLKGDYLCPMIDARRMEVFNAVFDTGNKTIRGVSADIIDENSFSDLLGHHRIFFFGDGADKCSSVIKNPNAVFIKGFMTSASFLAKPSRDAWEQNRFEDVAYFEPYYLKEFIATVPRNQILTNRKQGT